MNGTGQGQMNVHIYIYTWNLFVLYFSASTLQNKAFSKKNNGHLRVPGLQIIIIYLLYVQFEITKSKLSQQFNFPTQDSKLAEVRLLPKVLLTKQRI